MRLLDQRVGGVIETERGLGAAAAVSEPASRIRSQIGVARSLGSRPWRTACWWTAASMAS